MGKHHAAEETFSVTPSQGWKIDLRGTVDDVRSIASHQWREMSTVERRAIYFATLLVYADAALAIKTSTAGSLAIACLLLCSSAVLALCNFLWPCFQVFDCVMKRVQTNQGENEMVAKSGSAHHAIL